MVNNHEYRVKYKINIVTHHMKHHANASGYDRLMDYIDATIISAPKKLTVWQRCIGRVFNKQINASGLKWYHHRSFITELAAARRWFKGSNQIFHFLYGENLFRYSGLLKGIKQSNSIIATYHMPPDKFNEGVRKKEYLKALDAIIVVSNLQLDLFARFIKPERVFFIPHGIDTKIFAPKSKNQGDERLRCVFVGSHMRDFDTLAKAAHLLSSRKAAIAFDVVTRKDFHRYFDGLNNVTLHSFVSDAELLTIYQRSDLLVLPLMDSTANNSLLEAMSCGLPIISTDLPSVRDYVNDNCALLMPKSNAGALAEAIIEISEDNGKRMEMGKQSRNQSLQFDWNKIAKKTLEVYQFIKK